jgi:ribosome maturation factor RimP
MIERVKEILVSELKTLGLELVDFKMSSKNNSSSLKIFIDRLDEKEAKCTLSIKDCEKVSKSLLKFLEVEDVLKGNYTLDVSTPGLNRSLNNIKDFKRFKGQNSFITLKNGETFEGVIEEVKDNDIDFKFGKKIKTISFLDIKKAKLKY